jgi:hypothetical protein
VVDPFGMPHEIDHVSRGTTLERFEDVQDDGLSVCEFSHSSESNSSSSPYP